MAKEGHNQQKPNGEVVDPEMELTRKRRDDIGLSVKLGKNEVVLQAHLKDFWNPLAGGTHDETGANGQ